MSKYLYLLALMALFSCRSDKDQKTNGEMESVETGKVFGNMPDGREVFEYTLTNSGGMEVKVINYGGIITSLKTPDRQGNAGNVVLGFDSLDEYLKDQSFFGALIGRYANRIERGKFSIGENNYTLSQNNGVNHLHGGKKGFHKRFWEISPEKTKRGPALRLTYTSEHMEEGYPGNLKLTVYYILTEENDLIVEYRGETDKPTIVNMTQHAYFNLSAGQSNTILNHLLKIKAEKYLPVDTTMIPLGEPEKVEGTPFDFNNSTPVGERIEAEHPQIKIGMGYDHCWVLKEEYNDTLQEVIEVYDPLSGRVMTIKTTEPGVQFYSGNFLDGSIVGQDNQKYTHRYALCLETGRYPNTPNKPSYPSATLMPGETYTSTTVFSFDTRQL